VLPEVNDEVIVAFEHGDIRRGYVIGGLWNGVDKPEQPAATDAANDTLDKRSFTSRGGHFLLFQDKSGDEFVQLATKDGKYSMKLAQDADGGGFIIDSDNKVVINAKSDVTIKTDAKLSIESASDITLKSQGGDLMLEGINVKVNATASLELKGVNTTLEGSGMGKVASNGVLEVKGSLVKIN
jgi:uncharacterized protein involved in type VI secretion and phage assembly